MIVDDNVNVTTKDHHVNEMILTVVTDGQRGHDQQHFFLIVTTQRLNAFNVNKTTTIKIVPTANKRVKTEANLVRAKEKVSPARTPTKENQTPLEKGKEIREAKKVEKERKVKQTTSTDPK